MANLNGVIVAFLSSQTAWIILYCVESYFATEAAHSLFFPIGVASLLGLVALIKYILPSDAYSKGNKKIEKRGLIFYVSCLFCWSCIIDGIFYLEAVGLTSGFTGFYIEIGEPYLGTSFGTLCNVWDVTVHYILYLRIIYCIDNGKGYRDVLLFNLGSMLCSMILLLIGGLGGIHGGFYPATFLNSPYVILPIYEVMTVMNSPRSLPSKLKSKDKLKNGFLRLFLTVTLIVAILYGFIRGWGAMGSPYPAAAYYANNIEPYIIEPAKFGYVWVVCMMFVGFVYQICTLYALYHPGCQWMLDWSTFFAGLQVYGSALMMAQFFIGVAPQYHPPPNMAVVVVLGNFLVAFTAVLTAYLVHTERGYFIKPATPATSSKKSK